MDGDEAADGDVAVVADGGAGAAFFEAAAVSLEPGADFAHGQAVEHADFDKVVEEPLGFGVEEAAGGLAAFVADGLEEEVAGLVVAVAFDFDGDDAETAEAVEGCPEEVYVVFLVGRVVFNVVDGDGLGPVGLEEVGDVGGGRFGDAGGIGHGVLF